MEESEIEKTGLKHVVVKWWKDKDKQATANKIQGAISTTDSELSGEWQLLFDVYLDVRYLS